jgi:predicted transposase YbfD/YdcC
MAATARLDLDEVLEHFEDLEDPRSSVNRLHPLPSVVVIAILGVLAGSNGPTAIADWAKTKGRFLEKLLELPHGIPSKDVFRRVLMALQPLAFQECFANWLTSLRRAAAEAAGLDKVLLAVDGKTLRRSHDAKKNLGALHSVSCWASELGLSLGQVATEEKSNEITAIPLVLSFVDLKGAIVTIDAMGTQTEIAQKIVDGKGDYVLALKGNQGTLFQAAADYLEACSLADFEDCDAERLETTEKKHGRIETRTYVQMPVPKDLSGAARWPGLQTLGAAILYCIRDGKETIEARFFISSLSVDIKQFARAVRNHWSIENTCHWCLDVTYREDESRIRDQNLRVNFAWLNRFTLSLLKQIPDKLSVARRRRMCGWSEEYLMEVVTKQGESVR